MAGGLFGAVLTLRDDKRKRDETRWQRGTTAIGAGDLQGGIAILNEAGKKYDYVLPREDGGITLMQTDGTPYSLTPEQFFYAKTGQIKDPTAEAYKQAQTKEMQSLAEKRAGETAEEKATRESRIQATQAGTAEAKARATGLESAQRQADVMNPLVVEKTKAEIARGESAETRAVEQHKSDMAGVPFTRNIAMAQVGNQALTAQAAVNRSGAENPMSERNILQLQKQIDQSLSNANPAGTTAKPRDVNGALALVAMLPEQEASDRLDEIENNLDVYFAPSAMPAPLAESGWTGWWGKETARKNETMTKAATDARTAAETTIQTLRQRFGGQTTPAASGLNSAPATTPPAGTPTTPLNIPMPRTPVSPPATQGGQIPGPMAPEVQGPSKPVSLIPPGPQVQSPQTQPTMSAMAGGDPTELKRALMTMVQNKLLTAKQAADLARQSGLIQ